DPAAAGFRDAEAATQIDLLRRRLPAGGVAATRVAPSLLEELSASPDPDLALRMAVDFVARAGPGVWRLLQENPPLCRLLASLFGTSAFLAKGFTQHPELLDALLLVGRAGPRRKRAEIERAIDAAGSSTEGEETVWNAIRRVQREELLRIGLA